MPGKLTDLSLMLPRGNQSMLAGVFLAEYLLSKGYLVSDLEQLPFQVAQSLLQDAYLIVERRLADMESSTKFVWERESTISLN
ncbi:MAG: hypothetical protein JW862_16615 [Anaerolineales bacterium]|nr:hypothetical protein [Anaerolineales bacterium]